MAGGLGNQDHLPSQEAAFRGLLHGQDGYAEPSVPASLAPFKPELISLAQDLVGAPRGKMTVDTGRCKSVCCAVILGNQMQLLNSHIGILLSNIIPETIGSLSKSWIVSATWSSPCLPLTMLEFPLSGRVTVRRFEWLLMPDRQTAISLILLECLFQQWRRLLSLRWKHQMMQMIYNPSVFLQGSRMWRNSHVGYHFCFMPIEARRVGLTGQVLEGHRLCSNDLVFPMPGSLCMGFTWSLYFAQRINEVMMSRVGSLHMVLPWFTIEVGQQSLIGLKLTRSSTLFMLTIWVCSLPIARQWKAAWRSCLRASNKRTFSFTQARSSTRESKLWALS